MDKFFGYTELKEATDAELGTALGELNVLKSLSNSELLTDKLTDASKEVREEIKSRDVRARNWEG